MTQRAVPLERVAVRLLWKVTLGVSLFLGAQLMVDLWLSPYSWADLHASSHGGQALATTVSRAFNNLTAMVLTFIALAVPITANLYTPRLIEIFVRDRINLAAMVFYAAMGANALFVQGMTLEPWAPPVQGTILVISGVTGFVVLIPYYLYVLSFLNPATIIRRVLELVYSQFEDLARGIRDVPLAQQRLDQELLNFGNIVLRAIDRADRDVSIAAVSGVREIVDRYGAVKSALPAAWFEVAAERFAGATDDAMSYLTRDRTWVEHRCLHQLSLAYVAALSKMPDAISAISDVNRRVAGVALTRNDDALVRLCVRHFNTFLREAIKRKDLHAIYDVYWQYAALAKDLMRERPATSLAIARHFKYYGDFARWQGMPFAHELAAADLAAVVEAAYDADAPNRAEFLATFATLHSDKATVRLTKSQAVLAAYFEERALARESQVLANCLDRSTLEHIETARDEILATDDPVFWEVTDRQRNLDYVHPGRRDGVRRVLDAAAARKRDAPPAA